MQYITAQAMLKLIYVAGILLDESIFGFIMIVVVDGEYVGDVEVGDAVDESVVIVVDISSVGDGVVNVSEHISRFGVSGQESYWPYTLESRAN